MSVNRIKGTTRVSTKRAAKAAVAGKPAAVAKSATPAAERKPMKIGDHVIEHARRMGPAAARKKALADSVAVFAPYQPAPGVLPKNTKPIAMDEALSGNFGELNTWAAAGDVGMMFAEGIGFLGYTYLAQLTQRPEYRRISERIGTEMTRKWIKYNVVSKIDDDAIKPIAKSPEEMGGNGDPAAPGAEPAGAGPDDVGEGPEVAAATAEEAAQAEQERVRASVAQKASAEKAKRVKELTDEMSRLKVKDAFFNIAEGDGWFGRYHLFLDQKGNDVDSDKGKAELKTSIGNGRNATSKAKVNKRNPITAVRCVEPMWCYPATYEASNPLKGNFYTPSAWYANGIEVHGSRLLTFVGRELPDILKPAYAFGGLSMSQMAKPYVDNWLRTRQAVADLIESFSVSGVYTNMQATLQDGGVEALKRIDLFNTMRSNSGAYALDKDTEEFFNVSTPLGTLDALQAQSQEQMSSVSGIPLIILLGITPQGLNASSEGEIRAFYDWIHAYQESFFRDHLQTVIHFVMRSLWNEIDEEITFEFEPLWSMTDKERAEIDKLEAETDQVRIDSGVLDPGEVRKALAAQPDSRYADINPEDVPEPPEEPPGPGDDPLNDGGDDEGGGDVDGADPTVAKDGWSEDDHPRADDGKFGSGGGGASSGAVSFLKSLFGGGEKGVKIKTEKGVDPGFVDNVKRAASSIPKPHADALIEAGVKVRVVKTIGNDVTGEYDPTQVQGFIETGWGSPTIVLPSAFELTVDGKKTVVPWADTERCTVHEMGHALDHVTGGVISPVIGRQARSDAKSLSPEEAYEARYFLSSSSEAFAELYALAFAPSSDSEIFFGGLSRTRAQQAFAKSLADVRQIEVSKNV